MRLDPDKKNLDVQQRSGRMPGYVNGIAVSLTAAQERQLRFLPTDGQATLLVLCRNSCVVIGLSVVPMSSFARKYVIEPAFDDDGKGKPLTDNSMIDRMVRVIVANGVKPNSIVFEPVSNGIDVPQHRMLRIVHRAARALAELLTVEVREIDLGMSGQLDRNLRSLAFVAKEEAASFEPKVVRDAQEAITDYSAEVLLRYEVFDGDPVAREIHEKRLLVLKGNLN
jgi:hypothetical protein